MKHTRYEKALLLFTLLFTASVLLTGCGKQEKQPVSGITSPSSGSAASDTASGEDGEGGSPDSPSGAYTLAPRELEVRFGDDGQGFLMHLYDNDTSAAIAKHVGTSAWRLPIYHYDDYENFQVMQYYDIPQRYEIPSGPEHITSVKAGEVYYSHPNRILLFYGDAEIEGEYTKIGYFDDTEEFRSAVSDNPVLDGWGNKIVLISGVNK